MITLDLFLFTPDTNNEPLFQSIQNWAADISGLQNLAGYDITAFNLSGPTAQEFNATERSLYFVNRNTSAIIGSIAGSNITQSNFTQSIMNIDSAALDGSGNIDNSDGGIIPIDLGGNGGLGFGIQIPRALWLIKGVFCSIKLLGSKNDATKAVWGAGSAYGYYRYFKK